MAEFAEGDRVRIDIPDETDPDHAQYHGEHGTIVAVLEDDAGRVTGETRDGALYRVQTGPEQVLDVRWRGCHGIVHKVAVYSIALAETAGR